MGLNVLISLLIRKVRLLQERTFNCTQNHTQQLETSTRLLEHLMATIAFEKIAIAVFSVS